MILLLVPSVIGACSVGQVAVSATRATAAADTSAEVERERNLCIIWKKMKFRRKKKKTEMHQ